MTHERVPHTSHGAPSWLPLVPGGDIALMLGLAHTLVTEGRHDRAFLSCYCVGFERYPLTRLERRLPEDGGVGGGAVGEPTAQRDDDAVRQRDAAELDR